MNERQMIAALKQMLAKRQPMGILDSYEVHGSLLISKFIVTGFFSVPGNNIKLFQFSAAFTKIRRGVNVVLAVVEQTAFYTKDEIKKLGV